MDAYNAASGGGLTSPCKAEGWGGHASPNKATGEGGAREDRIKVLYDDEDKKWFRFFRAFFLCFFIAPSEDRIENYLSQGRQIRHPPPPRTLARSPPPPQNSCAQNLGHSLRT